MMANVSEKAKINNGGKFEFTSSLSYYYCKAEISKHFSKFCSTKKLGLLHTYCSYSVITKDSSLSLGGAIIGLHVHAHKRAQATPVNYHSPTKYGSSP